MFIACNHPIYSAKLVICAVTINPNTKLTRLRVGWHTMQHLGLGEIVFVICGSVSSRNICLCKHVSPLSTFSIICLIHSSVRPTITDLGYLYISALQGGPSRPQQPTSCQYDKMLSDGPKWIKISMSRTSIPIPNATVAITHRKGDCGVVACLMILAWLLEWFSFVKHLNDAIINCRWWFSVSCITKLQMKMRTYLSHNIDVAAKGQYTF